MAKPRADLSANLGTNITLLRKKANLSQAQLAKLSSLPRSTLTYLESGSSNPSLRNLARVAQALQVSIEELLARPRAQCQLIPAAEIRKLVRGHDEVEIFKLLPDPIPGMEIDRMEIPSGARLGGVPHLSNTKEYFAVISGEVQVAVGGEKYLVRAGDVLAFPGDQAHSYYNSGRSKAICFSVVSLAFLNIRI